jgi:hypothetical protein
MRGTYRNIRIAVRNRWGIMHTHASIFYLVILNSRRAEGAYFVTQRVVLYLDRGGCRLFFTVSSARYIVTQTWVRNARDLVQCIMNALVIFV